MDRGGHFFVEKGLDGFPKTMKQGWCSKDMVRHARCTITGTVMILMTVAAAMVVWFWALRPLCFASYLTSPGASDADIIRQYWPHRVVEPEWVGATPDRLLNWHITETVARLVVVSVLWLLITGVVAYGLIRRSRWLQRTARSGVPTRLREGCESRAASAEGCLRIGGSAAPGESRYFADSVFAAPKTMTNDECLMTNQ